MWLPVLLSLYCLLSPYSLLTDQLPIQMFLFASPQRRQLRFSCKQLHFLFGGWHIDLLMLPLKGVISSMVFDNHVFFQRRGRGRRRLLPLFLLLQDCLFDLWMKVSAIKMYYVPFKSNSTEIRLVYLSKCGIISCKEPRYRTRHSWVKSQLCLKELCDIEEAS